MAEEPKVSKAQQRAVNKYVKNNYDRINVTFPKGQKEILKAYAEQHGKSVNSFIVYAVNEVMNHNTGLSEKGGNIPPCCPLDVLADAQNAAQAAGEEVQDFVTRAVKSQAKRDEISRKMGMPPVTK